MLIVLRMKEIFRTLENDYVEFEESIIKIIIDSLEKVWFSVRDVVIALGYSNFKGAMKKHVDRRYVKKKCDIDGHKDNMQPHAMYISEAGFYKLISRSRMPAAGRFVDWVFDDLLPTIRKYGKYKLKKEYDNEMVKLSDQINILVKQNKLYKNDLAKTKYPDGGVFYVVDYSDDQGEMYRIGITDKMKNRKKGYDTHTLHKHQVVLIEEIENPVKLENCMKGALHDYRYRNNKDFYECSLGYIKKKLRLCLKCVAKDDEQKGGYENYIDDRIKKMSNRMNYIKDKIDEIDKFLDQ